MTQQKLPKDWILDVSDSSSADDEVEQKRKRKSEPDVEYWTRVIALRDFDVNNIRLYDVKKDLETDRHLKLIRKMTSSANGKAIFDPDAFKNIGYGFDVKDHALTQDQLLAYAEDITQIRRALRQKAKSSLLASDSDEEQEVEE